MSKNPDVYTKLLKELCSNCLDLIKAVFSRLHLKENNIKVRDAIIDREVESFFAKTNLDKNLKCTDQKDDLSDRPKLQQYLQHCCRLRNYFASIKKCGEATCTICLPPRLPNKGFQSVNHLPDPTPDEASEGHYLKFSKLFGTDTEESHTPSLKVRQAQKSNIGYTAVKQHATNTNLTLTCTECDKPRLVLAKKKPPTAVLHKFKRHTADLYFTCGTTVAELTGNDKEFVEHLQIKGNLTCQMPVEKLYYSAGYEFCCCHCGAKRKLIRHISFYPICSSCKRNKKEQVAKPKGTKTKTNLH